MSPLDSLVEELRAEDPAIRTAVIAKIENLAGTPEETSFLEKLLERDFDPETRFQILLIHAQFKGRQERDVDSAKAAEEVLGILGNTAPDVMGLFRRIPHLARPEIAGIVSALAQTPFERFPEEALPAIISFYGKHAGPEALGKIAPFLGHANPRILAVTVEVFEKKDPETLKEFLVPLLTNPTSGIRSKAIRLLHRWDPQEALKHFEDMLFSETPSEREAALFHAFFFPFGSIELSVLRFCGTEEDLNLIRRAGKLFIINPSFENSLRLMELYENSVGEKRDEIREIIVRVVDFLCKSGISQGTAQETFENLKNLYRKEKIRKALDRCSVLLGSELPEERRMAICKLLEWRDAGVEGAEALLQEQRTREANPELLELLNPAPPGIAPAETKPATESVPWGSLLGLPREGYLRARETLFSGMDTTERKVEVLRLIAAHEDQAGRETALTLLSDGSLEVVENAIGALIRLDPSSLAPHIDGLLQNPSVEIQVRALGAMLLMDKKRALTELERLLFSAQAERRKVGILGATEFDFPSVEHLLLKSLASESEKENLACHLRLFKTHLDEPTTFAVFSLSLQRPDGALEPLSRNLAAEFLRERKPPFPDVESLLKSWKDKLEPSRGGKEPPAEDYSLAHVRKLRAATPGPEPTRTQRTRGGGNESGVGAEFSELDSSDPIRRFLFLETISGKNLGSERKSHLVWLEKHHRDSATRFHLKLVLERISQECAPISASVNPLETIENALKSSPPDFIRLLPSLEIVPRRASAAVLALIREGGWEGWPREVLPFVFRFFKRVGSSEDSRGISRFCRHEDPRVSAMAIEALEKVNPDDLKPFLVPMLVSENATLRSMAVRLLCKWDPPEALRHFEAGLFSSDPEERHASIYQAFFMPFPAIEPLLLRFLSLETDPELLRKVGNLFRINPLPEEPIRLVGILEKAGGEKRGLLSSVLGGVIEALSKAGLIDKDPQRIAEDLKQEFRLKKARELLESYSPLIVSPDPENFRTAVFQIGKLIGMGFSESVEFVQRRAQTEQDAERRQALLDLIRPGRPPKEAEKASPETLPDKDLLEWLPRIDAEGFRRSRSSLSTLLGKRGKEVRSAIIRVFGRLGSPGDVQLVKRHLKDQDGEVISAAIGVLHAWAPDLLLEYLPKLTDHSSSQVQSAALAALCCLDQKQAFAVAEQMLGSKKPRQRETAILSLQDFDFPVVQDLVLELLRSEERPDNRVHLVRLLKANISPALLVKVFEALRNGPESRREQDIAVLNEFCRILAENALRTCGSAAGVFKWAEDQAKILERKRRQPPPVYDLERIRKIREEQRAKREAERPFLEKLGNRLSRIGIPERAVSGLFAAGALGVVFYFFLSDSAPVEKPLPKPAAVKKQKEGFVQDKVFSVQGGITKVSPGSIEVSQDGTGDLLTVKFPKGMPDYRMGHPFRGQVKIKKVDGKSVQGEIVVTY